MVGKACALRLAAGGFSVFAGVRKDRDAKALAESGLRRLSPVILDVTDEATISEAARTIGATVGPSGLAGLVNNAGIAVTGPVELVPLRELRRQWPEARRRRVRWCTGPEGGCGRIAGASPRPRG